MATYEPLVYIVEDEPLYRLLIEHALEKHSFNNYKCFSSGEKCLEEIGNNPDVIFLDYYLDNRDGLDILKEIKKIRRKTKVIFLSSQKNIRVAVEAMKSGASDYIVKDSFAFKKMIKALKKIKDTRVLKGVTLVKSVLIAWVIIALIYAILSYSF